MLDEPRGAAYTCREYREEMLLLGLRRQLESAGPSAAERDRLQREIARLEAAMGLT